MGVRVAVIGAGISGLACASVLARAGLSVSVFEKSRGVGGRSPTRWVDVRSVPPVGFDHGTQYFHAESALFEEVVLDAQKAGAVAPWSGSVVDLAYGVVNDHSSGPVRWVGSPGMASFSRYLARDLNVFSQTRVVRITGQDKQWCLTVQDADQRESDQLFDWVICAAPAEQAAQLLEGISEKAAKLASAVHSSVTWSALLTFGERLALSYDAAFVVDSPLGWICRDSSKPGRAPGERWIAHATADWSSHHQNEPGEAVADRLVDVFHSVVGLYVQPEIAKVHRWLYSIPVNPLSEMCLIDRSAHWGACGDWLAQGNVESAYESGHQLAQSIKASL